MTAANSKNSEKHDLQPKDPPTAPPRPQARARSLAWWRRAALLVLATIALLPSLIQLARAEFGRRNLALCYEAELDDNDRLAEQYLDRALGWNRTDDLIQNYRASFMIRRGRASEVLADAESTLHAARGAYQASPSAATRSRLAGALNLAAYICGLSDVNLETSLEHINEALDLFGDPTNSAMLDTRGYVLWRLGRHEEALQDMNLAVEEHKHDYLIRRRVLQNRSTYIVDERVAARQMKQLDEGLAAFYFHRALVNQSLGRNEQAARDFQRITNLGFDPDTGVF